MLVQAIVTTDVCTVVASISLCQIQYLLSMVTVTTWLAFQQHLFIFDNWYLFDRRGTDIRYGSSIVVLSSIVYYLMFIGDYCDSVAMSDTLPSSAL